MDYQLFLLANGLAGHSAGLDRTMALVAGYGAVLYVLSLVWLWGVSSRRADAARDRLAVGRALAGAAVAMAIGKVITRVAPRPRPFVAHAVRLLMAHAPTPSFPSDHALAAFAIGTVLLPTHRRLGAGLLAFGGLIGLARVFVGIHYPGDIVAGALIGVVVGLLVPRADPLIAPPVRLAARWTDALLGRAGGR